MFLLFLSTVYFKVKKNFWTHTVAILVFFRTLTVENPAMKEFESQWLKNKSKTELWALVQHGNPQEIIPYSIALTSKLNEVESLLHFYILVQ